ncbi:MAG: alpha/beta hydrolase [Gemmataceae bacterium]
MSRFAACLVLLLSGCLSLENRLVYFPAPAQTPATPLPAPLADVDLRLADGTAIHARWCPHPHAKCVILYCHGNAGNLEGRGALAHEMWRRLGASVLMFDYPGYGWSKGTPSEAGCYAAAQAAYDWLVEEMGIAPRDIVLVGESLGGGVAVELASRSEHRALVLIRTFTSLPDVASSLYPWLPVHAWMSNRFDSLARLKKCRRPIFIAQADKDAIMPFAHGERLKDACRGPSAFMVLEGLGHNDPLPVAFFERLGSFLEANP